MSSNPCGKLRLSHLPGGNLENRLDCVRLLNLQVVAVHVEEKQNGQKSGSLVAVEKGMVADEAESICRSQPGNVDDWLVGKDVQGAVLGRARLQPCR